MIDQAERLARLRLARTDRIGPVAFRELLRRQGSAQAALEALPDLSRRNGGAGLTPVSLSEAEDEMARGQVLGAELIVWGDEAFPAALVALDPPPPLLWCRGRIELLSGTAVAIVGARIASAAGQRFARGLAQELGMAGLRVVSGMARGIDGAAHLGALDTGTVAVLGGGVDDVYPPDHAELYGRLVETGCVVSESPVGARAQARDFPRRNRIISGLSRAVVVVEAELRSGSLITARMAAEQGREVLAVPGSPLDPRSKGTNDLIRQGAALCEGLDDVLRALEGTGGVWEPASPYADDEGPDLAVPDGLAERLVDLVGPSPVSRDELVRLTGAPTGQVLSALVELALSGRIRLEADGTVCEP